MSSDLKTSELCQKMDALRRTMANQGTAIHHDVEAIKGNVKNALDIKHQVLSRAVLASMFAGALGFFLIPKRSKKSEPRQTETVENLIADLREKFGINEQVPESNLNSSTWAKTMFELAKGFAVQTLISQGKKRLLAYLTNLASHSNRSNNSDRDDVENAFGTTHSGASL